MTCFSKNDQIAVPILYTPAAKFLLSSKGRLKIHVLTIATFLINMELKTQYDRSIRQKVSPKSSNEFKQINSVRNGLAVGEIGEMVLEVLEPGLFA